MDNNEILVQFHRSHYEELLNATAQRDHFRNTETVPMAQQVHLALGKAVESAQGVLCRYEVFQGTALCQEPDL